MRGKYSSGKGSVLPIHTIVRVDASLQRRSQQQTVHQCTRQCCYTFEANLLTDISNVSYAIPNYSKFGSFGVSVSKLFLRIGRCSSRHDRSKKLRIRMLPCPTFSKGCFFPGSTPETTSGLLLNGPGSLGLLLTSKQRKKSLDRSLELWKPRWLNIRIGICA